MYSLHQGLDYHQVFSYLVVLALLLFSTALTGCTDIEAIAVKQDGHILIVRSAFGGDRVEECTEVERNLACQSYRIDFQN
jgi:hypothetical protein